MIPYAPEPLQALRKRLPSALDCTIDPEVVKADPSKTPGKDRKHVFDFQFGIRLIISMELGIGLHVSASYIPETPLEKRLRKAVRVGGPGAGIERLRSEGEDAFRRLAGPRTKLEFLGLSAGAGIPHWRADSCQL